MSHILLTVLAIKEVMIYKEGALYEKMAIEVGPSAIIPVRSVTIRLFQEKVSEDLYWSSPQTGTGTFAGYKVD